MIEVDIDQHVVAVGQFDVSGVSLADIKKSYDKIFGLIHCLVQPSLPSVMCGRLLNRTLLGLFLTGLPEMAKLKENGF
jgi:hypothetical protein